LNLAEHWLNIPRWIKWTKMLSHTTLKSQVLLKISYISLI